MHNIASRLRANIIKENSEFHKSESQNSMSKQLFMDVRSRKLEPLNYSIGGASMAMRNQLMESVYSRSGMRKNEEEKKAIGDDSDLKGLSEMIEQS